MNSKDEAKCYWITGLSGSGKTSISKLLTNHLQNQNLPVIHLDGDILRGVFSSTGYTYDDRKAYGFQFARLCQLITNQKINVVIGIIGLFHDLHNFNRKNINNYVEIFLDTPVNEVKKRDIKNLYEKAEKGEIKNVVGIDIAPEFPLSPDVKISWKEGKNIEETFKEILSKLQ